MINAMPDMAIYQVNAKESQSIQVNSPLEIPEDKLDNDNQLCNYFDEN